MSPLVDNAGKTVVAVTHDVDIAACADRRIRLIEGAIAWDERLGH